MNNLNLSLNDYELIKKAVKRRYSKGNINTEELEDLLHDSIIQIMQINRPIIESTKIGFILTSFKYKVYDMFNHKKKFDNYKPYLLIHTKLQEETLVSQYDILLKKEQISIFEKRTKLRSKMNGRSKSVLREDGLFFKSTREAAVYMKVGKSTISNAINNKWRCGGFYWSFYDE